jgi:hypothetical protein
MNHEEVLKEIHENIITVDVRLLLKMQDIVLFFSGQITLWAISRDILRGPRLL